MLHALSWLFVNVLQGMSMYFSYKIKSLVVSYDIGSIVAIYHSFVYLSFLGNQLVAPMYLHCSMPFQLSMLLQHLSRACKMWTVMTRNLYHALLNHVVGSHLRNAKKALCIFKMLRLLSMILPKQRKEKFYKLKILILNQSRFEELYHRGFQNCCRS